jgi:hypothetical protein
MSIVTYGRRRGAVLVAAAVTAAFASAGMAAGAGPTEVGSVIAFDQERIEFEPGTDNAIREGEVDSGNSDRWILRAAAGQKMDLSIDSVDDNVAFAVFAPDRTLLATVTDDTFWTGTLPASGDYSVEVASLGGGAFYRMKVWIDAEFIDPLGSVQRMSFAPGTSSGTASGAVVRASEDWWFLGAAAGQTMQVDVTSLEANSTFDVYAPDGTLLTAPDDRTTWSWQLPQSGDYVVVVTPTRGNSTYTITVRITGGNTPAQQPQPQQSPPPTQAPTQSPPSSTTRRISFAPGTDNLAVEDSIANGETHIWLVGAAEGQTLAVFLESDIGDIWFNVFDPNGEPMAIQQQEWSVELVQSGDFEVEVTNSTGIVGAYRLTVFVT